MNLGNRLIAVTGGGDAEGDLDVTDELTLNGAGAGATVLDGGALDRLLEVHPGVKATASGVSIVNGNAASGGGGIWNGGDLTLCDSEVSGNVGGSTGGCNGSGGGLHNQTGAVATLERVTVSNNTGGWLGGGIRNKDDATLTVLDSTIEGNVGQGHGGGIYDEGGTVTVERSTLSGNSAATCCANCEGGALSTQACGSGGLVTIRNSTVSGNVAHAGGGISNGTFCPGNAVVIESSTITGNSGGLRNASTTTLAGTIIAGNDGGDCVPVAGSIDSLGYNLDGDGSCGLAGPGDLSGLDPLLGPLEDNGGPTATHALLTGSPAIDTGDPACPPPTEDQRGVAQPADGDGDGGAACDIGAFELEAEEGIGGTVSGMTPNGVLCWNRTTGQRLLVPSDATSWDCEELGLVVDPGDLVFTGATGTAD